MARIYLKSYLCPHCETKCSFFGNGSGNSIALYCNSCKEGVFFKLSGSNNLRDDYQDLIRLDDFQIEISYPHAKVSADDAIPEEIAEDFKEAKKCISVDAKKATVTMCRRVLQNTCIAKGCNPKSDLINQIDELESNRLISPSMKDIAHTIRKVGNWGAHPQNDPLKDVTLEDASELLEFTSEFLDEIFVRISRLQTLKQKKGMK